MTLPPGISDWLASPTLSGWDFAFAAISLLAAWIASIFARRGIIALGRRVDGIGDGFAILIARLVRYAILLTGVGVALTFLGASIQPLIAVGLIIAVVVFLALRGVSANFAAGVILQTRHPVNVGDDIQFDQFHGIVQELNGRSVVILTRDGRTVHVPNSSMLENPIVNFTSSGRHRSEVQVRIETTADAAEIARQTILKAAADHEEVQAEPAPRLITTSIEPARIGVTLQFWHAPVPAPPIVSAVADSVAAALTLGGYRAVVTTESPDPALTPPPPV